LDYQEILTSKVPKSLEIYSVSSRSSKRKLERDIRAWYGLSWEEYADIRNEMLDKKEFVTMGELHDTLVKRIIIDLMGRGFLKLRDNSGVENIKFVMTEKATNQVIMALSKNIKGLPKEPYQALIYLRNLSLLHE
jgi:hypothetical protein